MRHRRHFVSAVLGIAGFGFTGLVPVPAFATAAADLGHVVSPAVSNDAPYLPVSFGNAGASVDSQTTYNQPVVGMASAPGGKGYWLVASDGGVFGFGDAQFFGSVAGQRLNQPVVGMASTPDGKGYWLVAADGGVFGFGDAQFFGSVAGQRLNQPVVGMASTPNGKGYWLVAADGGIFAFGDAGYHGSTGALRLNEPVVGMAASRNGYWLVASDGGIFAFGDALYLGSMGGQHLNQPVVGMASAPGGKGYWLVASDGGVFTFGTSRFYGSMGGQQWNNPITAITATPDGGGYWLLPTTSVSFSVGRAILPPATTPPVVDECLQALGYAEDGSFGPLACDNGRQLNVLAWKAAAGLDPSIMRLGLEATSSQVDAALCADLPSSTIPIETGVYQLSAMYYGWTIGYTANSVFSILESC
jgi:hypothetical protein